MKFFRISSCAAALLAALATFGDTYTHITTQTVVSVGSPTALQIETTWTFEDTVVDGVSGLKLIQVSPTLYQKDQSVPDVIMDEYGKAHTVIEYGDRVFADSPFLTGLTIANTVLKIDDYVFSNCTALTEIKLSENLRYLGKRPFINTSVKELTLPDTLLNMDGNPAAGMPFDAAVNISDSSHFCYSDDGLLLLNRDRTRLYACATRAEGFVEIPKTVTEIMPDAFYGCFRLKCLNIPAQVTRIGSEAFNVTGYWPQHDAPESTPLLGMIFFQGRDPAAITVADDIFSGTPATLTSYAFDARWSSLQPTWKDRALEINSGKFTTEEFEADYLGVTWKFRLVSEDGVSLYAELWSGSGPCISTTTKCSNNGVDLSYLEVPSSLFGFPVNRIGDNAFFGCGNCATMLLPSSLSSIGDRAFAGCTALTRVGLALADAPDNQLTLPTGVRDLGERPFDGMDKVTALSIPSSLKNLDGNPLAGCANVTEIEVSKANRYFRYESPFLLNSDRTVLYACLPSATEITIPDTVTTIAKYAFENCDMLQSVTFAKPVTGTVPADTFDGLDAVTVRIDINTAAGWEPLTNNAPWKALVEDGRFITYGALDPTGDAERSFTDEDTGITWLYRVQGGYATLTGLERNGADISELTLPVSLGGYTVTKIGNGAFAGIMEIESVVIPSAQYREIGDYAFQDCECLWSVDLNSIRSLGKAPFFNTALEELTLPKTLQSVDGNPLAGCYWLEKIAVDAKNRYFTADEDGLCLYEDKGATLVGCSPYAEEITFLSTLKTIEPSAFADCIWLESIYAYCDAPTADEHIFDGIYDKPTIYVDAISHDWGDPVPATWNGAKLSNTSDLNGGSVWTDSSGIGWKYTVSDSVATILSVTAAHDAPIYSLSVPQTVSERWPVKRLGNLVFANLTSLSSVTIPATCNIIGDYAFSNCTALTSVTIPAGVRVLGKAPFYGTAISALAIPNTVTSINGNPLAGCIFATSVSVDDGNPFFSAEDGLLLNKAKSVLRAVVPSYTEITLPKSVTAIAGDAFAGCKALESITALCEDPGETADLLDDTPSALEVKADAETLTSWKKYVGTTWCGRLFVNLGDPDAAATYTDGSGTVWRYRVEDSVAVITSVYNEDDSSITALTLPATIRKYTVKAIDTAALANLRGLTAVTIPATYETVGDYAFSNCTSLAAVDIQSGVKTLGKAPFFGTAITALAIPNTVTSIDGNPLAGCVYASSITVAADNPFFTATDNLLFDKAAAELLACAPSVTEITLPKSVTAIAGDAFAGCKALESITALCEDPGETANLLDATPSTLEVKADAETLTSWKKYVGTTWCGRDFVNLGDPDAGTTYTDAGGTVWRYRVEDNVAVITSVYNEDDSSITALTLPATIRKYTVKAIDTAALANLRGLTAVTIPATYETIGDYAFSNCTSLAAVDIQSGVKTLGKAPFYGTAITALAIPNTVTSIDGNPLTGCEFVTTISVDAGNKYFSSDDDGQLLLNKSAKTLLACATAATQITVPASVSMIVDDAFAGCDALQLVNMLGAKEPAANDIFADMTETPVIKVDLSDISGWTLVDGKWKGCTFINSGSTFDVDADGLFWSYDIADGVATIISVMRPDGAIIKSLTLPESLGMFGVKSIGSRAFTNLQFLTSVIIPSTYESIGDCAFSNCTSLAVIDIPSGIKTLGKAPFYGTAIAALSIPNTVTKIDGNPFAGCEFVTSVAVDASNPKFSTDDAGTLLFDKAKTELLACIPSATEITVPASVAKIADNAFSGCAALQLVEMLCSEPDASDEVFDDTPSTLIVKTDTGMTGVWSEVSDGKWKSRQFMDTSASVIVDDNGFIWFYELDDDVATITAVSRADNDVIETLTLPTTVDGKGVKAIDDMAFANMRFLSAVSIPSTYESIGDYAFSNCTALASVDIASGVRTLGKATFFGTAITALTIPNTVTSIDGNPLAGCEFVTSVSVDAGNKYFSSDDDGQLLLNKSAKTLLACATAATQITVPASVSMIVDDAFAGCDALQLVNMLGAKEPAANDIFADMAETPVIRVDLSDISGWTLVDGKWKGCTFINTGSTFDVDADGLLWSYDIADGVATIISVMRPDGAIIKSLTLPESLGRFGVKSIGSRAFTNLQFLTSVTIPSTYESIGDHAFSNCTSLAAIDIPSGVKTLGKAPFYGTAITTLAIPNTVTSIDGNPFAGCELITSVSVDAGNPKFATDDAGTLLFDKAKTVLLACVPSATEITVPASVRKIADNAFADCAALQLVEMLCSEPAAADTVFNGTPATLIVKTDTGATGEWSEVADGKWKSRQFMDTSASVIVDDNGFIWFYELDDDVATITAVSRTDNEYIRTLTLPESVDGHGVKAIDDFAFANLRFLTSVSIPSTYEAIGDCAFSNCTSLATVDIASGVRTLGKAPFYGTAITALTIPNTVTKIDGNPFAGCEFVSSVSVASNNKMFSANAAGTLLFNKAKTELLACVPSATEITVPATVTKIADSAFTDCSALLIVEMLCSEPTAADTVFNGTPATLVVKTDTGVTGTWSEVADGKWKDRRFMDTRSSIIVDDDGYVWAYEIHDNVATITSVSYGGTEVIQALELPVTIDGKGVKGIGDFAFANLRFLTTVSVPATYESIGDCAFSNCTALTTVNIAPGVRSLGKAPFCGTAITELAIPYTVTSIDGNPFAGCEFVSKVTVDASNPKFSTDDSGTLLFNKTKTELLACVPSVTEITIPASVTKLADNAFTDCAALQLVVMLCSEPVAADTVFDGTPTTLIVKTDTGVTGTWSEVADEKWKGRRFMDTRSSIIVDDSGYIWYYEIYDGVATITAVERTDGSVIETLALPTSVDGNGVKGIGDFAFASLRFLTSVSIPATYESIGDCAFSNCTSLTSVDIGSGLLSLGKAPFYGTKISTLAIPKFVTSIDGNPAAGCEYLEYFSVAAGSPRFSTADSGALLLDKRQTRLLACASYAEEITVPASVTSIAADAFDSCSLLTSVTFLGDEPEADSRIFRDTPVYLIVSVDAYNCDWGDEIPLTWKGRELRNIGTDYGNTSTYTDADGLWWDYRLNRDGVSIVAVDSRAEGDVTVPSSIAVDGLGTLSVTAIDSGAFANCSDVTSIDIPASVSSIASDAFDGCTALQGFSVSAANKTYRSGAKTGALYSRDGKTLYKVPAGYRFKTVFNLSIDTVSRMENRIIEFPSSEPGVLTTPINRIEQIPGTETSSQTETWTFLPTLGVTELLSGVERIADNAFTDCGTLPEGIIADGDLKIASGSTVKTQKGPVEIVIGTDSTPRKGGESEQTVSSYADPDYVKLTVKISQTTTNFTFSVPFPEIPSSVTYTKQSFYGSPWYNSVPDDPIPSISDHPTSAEIRYVLEDAADTRLAANIQDETEYSSFREWASVIGQQDVMNNASAWTAYALDLNVLPAEELTDEDVQVDEFKLEGTDSMLLQVGIKDLKIGKKATEERLRKIFDIEAADSLDPQAFSEDNIILEFGTPNDAGRVPVTAIPDMQGATSVFIKGGLR